MDRTQSCTETWQSLKKSANGSKAAGKGQRFAKSTLDNCLLMEVMENRSKGVLEKDDLRRFL